MSSIDTSDNRNEGLHTDRESGPGAAIPRQADEQSGTTGIAIPLDTLNPLPLVSSLLYRVPHYVHPHGTRFDCEALSVPTDLLYQLVTISRRLFPSLVFRFFFLSLPHEVLCRMFRTYRNLYRR